MNEKNELNKELSATSLAKELNMTLQSVIQILLDMGLIARRGKVWNLTPMGFSKGGKYRESSQSGRYIVWPKSIIMELDESNEPSGQLLTATTVGKSFDLPANRVNSIFSELGWIKKDPVNGWLITELGKRQGGIQTKYKTGVPYVRWPSSIINNKILTTSVLESKGEVSSVGQDSRPGGSSESKGFREKFPATLRTKDGHLVRSKSEIIIDNWLYDSKIVHAVERKLQTEEEVYCDWWIPTGKVYIEFWGLDDPQYLARKERKILIYEKYHFKLIQLSEKDMSNIYDILPAKLREFDVIPED